MNAGNFCIQKHIKGDKCRSLDDKLDSKSMKLPSYFCLMLVLNPQIVCQNRTSKIYTFCSRFLFVDNKITKWSLHISIQSSVWWW